jgi:hypothetical protein
MLKALQTITEMVVKQAQQRAVQESTGSTASSQYGTQGSTTTYSRSQDGLAHPYLAIGRAVDGFSDTGSQILAQSTWESLN